MKSYNCLHLCVHETPNLFFGPSTRQKSSTSFARRGHFPPEMALKSFPQQRRHASSILFSRSLLLFLVSSLYYSLEGIKFQSRRIAKEFNGYGSLNCITFVSKVKNPLQSALTTSWVVKIGSKHLNDAHSSHHLSAANEEKRKECLHLEFKRMSRISAHIGEEDTHVNAAINKRVCLGEPTYHHN